MAEKTATELEHVAFMLLSHRMYADEAEFELKGVKAVDECLVPKRRPAFKEAFKALEQVGCRSEILNLNLYRLDNAAQRPLKFVSIKQLRNAAAALARAAKAIQKLQGCDLFGITAALCARAGAPATVAQFLGDPKSPEVLACSAKVLPNWRAPRSDIVRSYARVANYIYPSIASGSPPAFTDGKRHLNLVIELLDAFENVNAKGLGSEGLIRKDLAYFMASHPDAYEIVRIFVITEHQHAFVNSSKITGADFRSALLVNMFTYSKWGKR
jgi:hypothetical protein